MRNCLALLVMLASAAWAAAADEKKVVKAPPIDEEILLRLFEEPDAHFHKAREKFFQRDYAGAAQSIRTATAFVQLEGLGATPGGGEMIHRSTAELEKLASGIESGSIRNAKMLDRVFSRAHVAMGRNHNRKAIELVASGDAASAAKQYRAAFHHASHAYQWGGIEEKEDARAAFKAAAAQVAKLRARAKVIREEIQTEVKALNMVLNSLAQELRMEEELKDLWQPIQ